MSHTPGPWALRKEWKRDKAPLEVWPKSKKVKKPFRPSPIANVCEHYDEFRANAALIASAPTLKAENESLREQNRELMEVARKTIDFCDSAIRDQEISQLDANDLWNLALSAIAKAEGKEAA